LSYELLELFIVLCQLYFKGFYNDINITLHPMAHLLLRALMKRYIFNTPGANVIKLLWP